MGWRFRRFLKASDSLEIHARDAPQLDAEALRKATGMNRFFSTGRIRIVFRFTTEGIMTSVEVL